MRFLQEEAITFDDVTLVPNYSTIKSRKEPDISSDVFKIPIIAAPMNTVCEARMATAITSMGGDAVIHRYMSIEEQVKIAKDYGAFWNVFYAIGATGDFYERAHALYKTGVKKFCIDVANGHSISSIQAIMTLKNEFKDISLMAGNVCTYDGFADLAEAGADLIRVGVGSGAMCKTRVVTGHGVPQLTALLWAKKAKESKEKYANVQIISDGGIRNSGDIVKALAIADVVMLGSLLAGTFEAPGSIIKENGEEYKLYAGMASEEGRSLNSWFDREKTSFVPEGESVKLKYKGSVIDVLNDLIGGLKVGMSYAGANTLSDLRGKATFIRITNNGMVEGTPHGKR